MNDRSAPLLLILLTAVPLQAAPKVPVVERTLAGKVVAVTDGDTVRVLVDGRELRVRLEGIDAPESKQAYGQRSKQALSELVFGKHVRLDVTGKDRYGRTLGLLYVDDEPVNVRMILEGMAWHYAYFNAEPTFAAAEKQAREARAGLWSDPDPVPPWEFRRQKPVKSR